MPPGGLPKREPLRLVVGHKMMDEHLIDILRAQIAASQQARPGLSLEEARATTKMTDELISDYLSIADHGTSAIAAFRIFAYLTSPQHDPGDKATTETVLRALLVRTEDEKYSLTSSDLEIALVLWDAGVVSSSTIETVVRRLAGRDDFKVVSAAQRLLPIIGEDFIQGYLNSALLSETSMGGPMRPMLKEMARDALSEFRKMNQ